MTFAYGLKEEIYKCRPSVRGLRLAQTYGLLLFSRSFSRSAISIQTEHEGTARLFCDDIVEHIGIQTSILYSEFEKKNGATVYTAAVEAEEDRLGIMRFFGHAPDEVRLSIRMENLDTETKRAAFISGAFLSGGNVTDPQKNYHIEFVTPHRQLCADLCTLLSSVLEAPKVASRRGKYVIYYKESEAVEDLMTFMGGQHSALQTMDVKIYKDMRNKVNRVTNCETANIEKTVAAALSQAEAIRRVIETRGLESLPEELRAVALLRMDNPDMSLRELGAALVPPLSRSGVNHRLLRILQLAGKGHGNAET